MLHQRQVLLIFVTIAILSGITVQSASGSLFEQFAIADTRFLSLINLTTLLSIAGGALTFFGLIRNQRAVTYFDEVVDEMTKVTWPTREEALRAATTVVTTSAIVASLIAFYDFMWKNIANFFLYTG
jgi:preprotein translocase SecE subunit